LFEDLDEGGKDCHDNFYQLTILLGMVGEGEYFLAERVEESLG
jgi:hypothetical protein